jgi:hypothetical protein
VSQVVNTVIHDKEQMEIISAVQDTMAKLEVDSPKTMHAQHIRRI